MTPTSHDIAAPAPAAEGTARIAVASRHLYDRECALHDARQTCNNTWVRTAGEKLHEAAVEYRHAVADNADREDGGTVNHHNPLTEAQTKLAAAIEIATGCTVDEVRHEPFNLRDGVCGNCGADTAVATLGVGTKARFIACCVDCIHTDDIAEPTTTAASR